MPVGTFKDLNDNNASGISDATSWSFTTGDTIAPEITILSPSDNATNVNPNNNLEITFNENIKKGNGNIIIKNSSNNSVIATIDVASSNVSIETNKVTINPSITLPENNRNVLLRFSNTAITDEYNNNFEGIF